VWGGGGEARAGETASSYHFPSMWVDTEWLARLSIAGIIANDSGTELSSSSNLEGYWFHPILCGYLPVSSAARVGVHHLEHHISRINTSLGHCDSPLDVVRCQAHRLFIHRTDMGHFRYGPIVPLYIIPAELVYEQKDNRDAGIRSSTRHRPMRRLSLAARRLRYI